MHLAILLEVFIANSVSSLPDLSWDSKTEDILHLMNQSEADFIRSVRHDTEDMPLHCRPDICPKKQMRNTIKGDIKWPETPAGKRKYIRCPFSFEEEIYAHYDCVLDESKNASWASNVMMVDCPGPPLHEAVLELTQDNQLRNLSMAECINNLERLRRIIIRYPDAPAFSLETNYTVKMVVQLLDRQNTEILSKKLLTSIMDVADFLLLKDSMSDTKKGKMVSAFTALADSALLNELLVGTVLSSFTNKLVFAMRNIDHPQDLSSQENIIDSSGFELNAKLFKSTNRTKTFVAMLFNVSLHPIVQKATKIEINVERTAVPVREDMSLSLVTPAFALERESLQNINNNNNYNNNTEPTTAYISISDKNERNTSVLLQENRLIALHTPRPLLSPRLSLMHMMTDQIVSSVFFVSGSIFTENESQGEIIYTIPHSAGLNGLACASTHSFNPDSATTNEADWFDTWYVSSLCRAANTTASTTTCVCLMRAGYYGLAYEHSLVAIYNRTSDYGDDLSVFLGFPYSIELHIAGHIFRAISVVCLVVTLLSYLLSKAGKGRPALILIHLCTSLLLLLIVLYIAEVTAHTKTGCQVANVLRYYLVMVSLLWNGVEAYNMYLMLIRVFNQHSHRLVTKAAVFSWGLPGVIIAIVYAADQKGFRGGYVDCIFRCILPEKTLYYAYLLPMCTLILHNLVVFGMVVKVLTSTPKHISSCNNEGLGRRSRYWRQLSGAVAMLVLLGVPWLFSAFGAVDHDASHAMKITEAAFQIIFVVFINMQGVFIFAFHCARNTDMRREWKSTFNSASSKKASGAGSTQDKLVKRNTETKETCV